MKRHIAAAAGVAAVAIACVAGAAPRSLERAADLFRRAEYARARREVAADTSSLRGAALDEAVLMLARLETDFPRVEALCRRAARSGDEEVAGRARLELGKMLYAAGDYEEALAVLAGAPPRGTEPMRNEAAFFTGLCRAQLGDDARAAADFQRVARGPYAVWSRLARAGLDAQAGRLPAAVETYEGIERDKPNPVALFRLGECYERLGDRDRAVARYRLLVDRFPRSLEAAKGQEKLALLAEARERPRGQGAAGGGETGGGREAISRTSETSRGFTLQFGAFEARANADAVSRKLGSSLRGIRVERVETEGRVWHRVRAGVYQTKEAAEKDAARVKGATGLAGTVVPLSP